MSTSCHSLAELQSVEFPGLKPSLLHEELPPVTPLAPVDEHSFVRTRASGPAAATAAARRLAPNNARASLLDILLSTALEEAPTAQNAEAFCLPPIMPAFPASPPAAPAPLAPPALRKRSLLPAPEVPAELLASLRAGRGAHSASGDASLSPSGSGSCSSSTDLDDTAASSEPGATHPALQQAISWITRRV